MFMKRILIRLAIMVAVLTSLGCEYAGHFTVVGNVHDSQGNPITSYQAQFCYILHFGFHEIDQGCEPVTTDGNGQFTTLVVTRGTYDEDFIGAELYLVTENGLQYSGQYDPNGLTFKKHDVLGTVIVDFTLPDSMKK